MTLAGTDQCHVQDASGGEPGSVSGAESQPTEPKRSLVGEFLEATAEMTPPTSLLEELRALRLAMDRQNELLGLIVAQNADLIERLLESEPEDDDELTHDLSGNPIR